MHKRKNLIVRLLIFMLSVTLSTGVIYAQNIIYVDDDATGNNDGSSWENAYTYLQDALADANESEKPVEIRVAQGIYKPDRGAGIIPGDREATFQLLNGVSLQGGYAGVGEPDPKARNTELYKTILDGDLLDNDTPIDNPELLREEPPTRTDNSFYVVKVQKSNQSTEIDGFIISSGSYSGLYASSQTDIIVRDCLFTSNACPGITSFSSNSIIESCIFKNNKNIWGVGGGIKIGGNSRILKCTFEDNFAAWDGGGLYGGGFLWLEDCTFTRNIACGLQCADVGSGGGLHFSNFQEDSKIIDCIFIENTASQGGGAQIGYSGMVPSSRREETILLSGCTFIRNQAGSGGAISQRLSYLDIFNCAFHDNSAVSHHGGAISTSNSITNLDNCIFSGNYALERGASLLVRGSKGAGSRGKPTLFDFALTLNNCTFRGNSSPVGRTLYCWSNGTEHLDNTIISNCIIDNEGNEIYNADDSTMTISYTNLRGGADAIYDPCEVLIWGDGNIDVDPLFVDPGYWANANDPNIITEPNGPNTVWIDGDYHLKSQSGRYDPNSGSWVIDDVTSPCIDAGDPNSPLGNEPEPNGGRINMGAYGGTPQASKSYAEE